MEDEYYLAIINWGAIIVIYNGTIKCGSIRTQLIEYNALSLNHISYDLHMRSSLIKAYILYCCIYMFLFILQIGQQQLYGYGCHHYIKRVSSTAYDLQYFEYLKMKRPIIIATLIFLALAAIKFRLNTQEETELKVGDSLISTLGIFKATLVQNGCRLSIQSFTESRNYRKVGDYTPTNFIGNCRSLVIRNGRITTQTNSTYIDLGKQGYDHSTVFTIDDYGVIRLIGTTFGVNGQTQISQQITASEFRQNATYFYPTSNLLFTFVDSVPEQTNLRRWVFAAQFGELLISQQDDRGIFIAYSYNYLRVGNSQLSDFNSRTFPGVIFQNITFTPRCLESRLYINYKPPFVFVADPYWPILTVYEQGRYKVFQIGYSQLFQTETWQSTHRLSVRNEISVCPKYTFQFQGDCVTFCPAPYYHELRSQYGYCVLTCQEYTPKNDTSRMCSCYSQYENPLVHLKNITACPANSIQYFYGCYCTANNTFFDRSISLTCVTNCPDETIGINGLCMQCPSQCLTCKRDRLFRSLLQCSKCKPRFAIVKGQCYRQCNPGYGFSLVGNAGCLKCTDAFCLNCSTNINICESCKLLYTLQGNSCVKKCDDLSSLVPYYGLKSQCIIRNAQCRQNKVVFYKNQPSLKCIRCANNQFMHIDTCVPTCPNGYQANRNSFCYCSNSSTITITDKCLPLVGCPIDMGWDSLSSSCTSCPFGCVSCFSAVCTACAPGFILLITPRNIICRKQSPLFTCDTENAIIQSSCLVIQYTDPSYGLIKCLNRIKNCKVCNLQDSDEICTLCRVDFYLYNNTCLTNCPNGTYPYINVCLVTQINDCGMPFLQLYYEEFIFNYDDISTSAAYSYYTVYGLEPMNDPIGYIPVYQELTSKINDGVSRNAQFYRSTWTCLKCRDGMGLSNDSLGCLPCPAPCLTCYKALSNSCLTRNTGCQYYIHSVSGLCVQSCSSAQFIPNIINGKLYCSPLSSSAVQEYARIDSAIYTDSQGKNRVFFIFDQTLQSGLNLLIPIFKQSSTPKLSNTGSGPNAQTQLAKLNSNGFLSLYDQDSSNSVYLVNMTSSISSIVGAENTLFPNTVYGAMKSQSHVQFMKSWLAFIGYIMSITLILLHVVFIGNNLLYKVDNVLILAQTIYFFSFVQLLVGKLLSQFYYGWIFAHFGFFPNFFPKFIPSSYVELEAPNSFKLATLDANIVRNAGFAFSLLLVFLACYAVITMICWMVGKLCRKEDVWQPVIAKNALLGGFQFISMTIFFWACANLMYIKGAELTNSDFYHTSKVLSIFFIIMIGLYTIIRGFFNPLGGLYMAKRILLAAILAASYLDKNMIAPLVLLEVIFTVFRYIQQSPQSKKQKIFLLAQCLLFVIVYLLCSLSLDAGTNTIIVSIIMFVLTVALAYDLTSVYLQSRNQWLVDEENVTDVQLNMAKAQAQKSAMSSYKPQSLIKQEEQ